MFLNHGCGLGKGDENMNLFGYIYILICGLFFTIFYKKIGHITAEVQYKFLHIRFNEVGYQISFLIIGIFSIIFAILMLLKII
jgi:hypothetical protein